jgi:colicin import membrane protein
MELKVSEDLKSSFFKSLLIHFFLVTLGFLLPKIIHLSSRNSDIEIINSSIRVDVVGMPKFTIKELKQIQKELVESQPSNTAEEKKATSPNTEDIIKKDDLVIQEKSKEKAKKSFLNMITNYSSKKIESQKGAKFSTKISSDNELNSLVIEGNKISKGSALTGDYSDEEISDFSIYVQSLPEVIRKYWKLPSYLMNQGLKCRIRIFLSTKGQLLKLEVQESSGQVEFDARAEDAIKKAAPYFPTPAETVSNRVASSGIILGFPL